MAGGSALALGGLLAGCGGGPKRITDCP